VIKHHPSIASEMQRFRKRKQVGKTKMLPGVLHNRDDRRAHAKLEANAALYDPPANPTPEDILIARDESAMIDAALLLLPARVERAVRLYHGWRDGEPHTLKQVSEVFGVGRARAHQILMQAYRRLQHPARRLGTLRGKYTDRWHAYPPRRKPWHTPVLEPIKRPWREPIIVEVKEPAVPAMWGPQVEAARRRAFDQDPQHVAEYAAALTAMLSAHRRGVRL
jgi:Sigma-70, region 4